MRRSLAIRIILAVTLMQVWVILSHIQPDNILKVIALLGAILISSPLHKIRKKKKRNISFQIAFVFGAWSLFGLLFWHLQLLDRRGPDLPTTIFFGLAFIAQGFYLWSMVLDTSDQKLRELYMPFTLSTEDQDHLLQINNKSLQETHPMKQTKMQNKSQ